ncbi:roadblock/LC7 domain-containing protein [Streptomyces sp. NPDC054796]
MDNETDTDTKTDTCARTDTDTDRAWMMREVVEVAGVRHVVVLSADGLPTTRCANTDRETGERVAAAASGLASLGRGLAAEFGTGGHAYHQTLTEYEGGFIFVRMAGDGSCLAVVTDARVNAGEIGYRMALQAQRFGEHQGTPYREQPVP